MTVVIYHNPACSTSRKALAAIREAGYEPQIIEYLKTPPDAGKLSELVAAIGVDSPDQLQPYHVSKCIAPNRVVSYEEAYHFLKPGVLLDGHCAPRLVFVGMQFPHMLAGFARARELDVILSGFESMCAIPLCLKPDGLGDYEQLSAAEVGIDSASEFEKPAGCADCSQRDRCWGLRRGYVQLYGSDELRPFLS